MNIVVIIIVLICIVAVAIVFANRQASGINNYGEATDRSDRDIAADINNYFANAITVYALKNHEDAKKAAFAAAKVVASIQRKSMISYLEGMASDIIQIVPSKLEAELIAVRLRALRIEIELKDWTIDDIREEKERLSEINPEYLDALNKADPDVFVRKHPDLFSNNMHLDRSS